MKWLYCVLLASCCEGCSGLPTQDIVNKAAEAEDQALAAAIWTQCQAVSVGAFDRRFGQWPEGAAAWRVLCRRPLSEIPSR